jgi:undecaprenol kinase
MKNLGFHRRLGFALAGIAAIARRERSFRTQIIAALAAIITMALLRPGLLWSAVVVLSIALVLALELLNSALEAMIDHLHPDIAPAIKIAKDAAAGAVLVTSAAAIAIGTLMLVAVLSPP